MIRTFSSNSQIKQFEKELDGEKMTLYLFNKKQIQELFPKFKILRKNTSESEKPPLPDVFFLELLMQKI